MQQRTAYILVFNIRQDAAPDAAPFATLEAARDCFDFMIGEAYIIEVATGKIIAYKPDKIYQPEGD